MAIVTTMNMAYTTPTTQAQAAASMMKMGCKRRLPITSYDNEEPAAKKQRSAPQKKSVHFASHKAIHVVPRVDDIDIPAVWWTTEEFQHSRRCDAHYIHIFNNNDQYKETLLRVLGTACGKMALDKDATFMLAYSPIRGLEREMSPCFRQRKKQVVQNVLQSQNALRAWKNDPKKAQQGADMLAAHYRKLAQPAVVFARLLAQGDAQVVASDEPRR